jgi:hypothetical protein
MPQSLAPTVMITDAFPSGLLISFLFLPSCPLPIQLIHPDSYPCTITKTQDHSTSSDSLLGLVSLSLLIVTHIYVPFICLYISLLYYIRPLSTSRHLSLAFICIHAKSPESQTPSHPLLLLVYNDLLETSSHWTNFEPQNPWLLLSILEFPHENLTPMSTASCG